MRSLKEIMAPLDSYREILVTLFTDGNGTTTAYDIQKALKLSPNEDERDVIYDQATDAFRYLLSMLDYEITEEDDGC